MKKKYNLKLQKNFGLIILFIGIWGIISLFSQSPIYASIFTVLVGTSFSVQFFIWAFIAIAGYSIYERAD